MSPCITGFSFLILGLLMANTLTSAAMSNLGFVYYSKAIADGRIGTSLLSTAQRRFGNAVELNLRNATAYRGLGAVCLAQSKISCALDELETSIQLDSSHAMTHYFLGETLYVSDQRIEATREWAKSGAVPRLNKVGQEFFEEGVLDASENIYRLALTVDDSNWEAHYMLGQILFQAGKYANALVHYQKGAEIEPNVYGLQLKLGHTYKELGRYGDAADSYQRALHIRPSDSWSLFYLGVVAWERGQIEDAKVRFEQALMQNPGNHFAHAYLGRFFSRKGYLEQARDEYLEAIRLSPETPGFHIDLAAIYKRMGKMDLAKQEDEVATALQQRQ